jgi:hypothetical protein
VIVVAGCMLFSMLSVYRFGQAAFGDARKALGFVLALEGVMLASHGAIGIVALAVLIAINAIANGCTIACARDATLRRRAADERRSATRAKNRGGRQTAAEQQGTPRQASAPQQDAPPRRPVVEIRGTAAPASGPAARRASCPKATPLPRSHWLPEQGVIEAEFLELS